MTGLVPFGVLVSTVYALRGATVVGDLVMAAPLDPTEPVTRSEGTQPVIAVYVGNEDQKMEGREILSGHRRLELSLQIFLPEATQVVINGQPVALDTRGPGSEVVFAALIRQIMRALQDTSTDWGRRWGCFICSVHEIVTQPFLFEMPGKFRGFAREVTIICETADEPEYGAEPYPFWLDFIAGLRGLPGYGDPVADLLLAELTATNGLPSWGLQAASMGDAVADAPTLGFGPPGPPVTPVLQDVGLDEAWTIPGTL